MKLRSLYAPLGVFGVLGNHDRWADGDLSEKCMTDAGITLIDNRAVWVEHEARAFPHRRSWRPDHKYTGYHADA